MGAEAFRSGLEKDENAILLDVRTAREVSRGIIPGAVNVDVSSADFAEKVSTFDKSKTYYVYCLSGSRSAKAASYLNSIGIEKAYNLEGGILSWQKKGFEIKTEEEIRDMISKAQYDEMVKSGSRVLVDFYAPWCAPCMRMEPMLEDLQQETAGQLKIIRVNIDENRKLARDFGVTEIPVLKYYIEGEEEWEVRGELKKNELVRRMKI